MSIMVVFHNRPEIRSAGFGPPKGAKRSDSDHVSGSKFGCGADSRGPDAKWRMASGIGNSAPRQIC